MKKMMFALAAVGAHAALAQLSYPIVDTAQNSYWDAARAIERPAPGSIYCGQDAQFSNNPPLYRASADRTVVRDRVTGLSWTSDPGRKKTWREAVDGASSCRVGGHDDWRLPSVKELYSLINFNGIEPDPRGWSGKVPFIDTEFFNFHYGKASENERIIDSQWISSTPCAGRRLRANRAVFGVNFADGRIKGYPVDGTTRRAAKTFYVLYVRGNEAYGKNEFVDRGDGTILDEATGLIWMQADSGEGMDWVSALRYADRMEFAGHSDWRLPHAKELQSIVDYRRGPDATGSAAINSLFFCTEIENEAGQRDFGYYWTSTTHISPRGGPRAVYIAFGRALGFLNGKWLDVHGAGSQRSDLKIGNAFDLQWGHGPQGDAQRIRNLVRLVRGGL